MSHLKALQLAELLPDLLQPILDLLSGMELGALWICGDKRLNSTMARIVTRFNLEYQPGPKPNRWPTLVTFFLQVTHVSIGYLAPFQQLRLLHVDYRLIPQGVRHLTLNFANALESFQQPESPLPASDFPISFIDMKSYFPKLESFYYALPRRAKQDPLGKASFLIDIPRLVSVLPMTLQTFSCAANNMTLDHIAVLPRNLTKLACRFAPCTTPRHAPYGEIFPPHLTQAELTQVSSDYLVEILPRGLTKLELNMQLDHRVSEQETVDLLHCLPPQLKELKIRYPSPLTLGFARALPRTLEYLNAQVQSAHAHALAHLPPNLTALFTSGKGATLSRVPENPNDRFTSFAQLPRNLRNMPLWVYSVCCSFDWSLLPPTLQSAYVFPDFEKKNSHPLVLPPSLMRIELAQVSPDFFPKLTPSLTEVTLDDCTLISEPIMQQLQGLKHLRNLAFYGDTPLLQAGLLNILETPLEALHLDYLPDIIDLELFHPWASQLRSLVIQSFARNSLQDSRDWFQSLPQTLDHIYLGTISVIIPPSILEYLTQVSFMHIIGIGSVHSHNFAALGRYKSLTSLSLRGEPTSISIEDLYSLPWTLTAASLPVCPKITQAQLSRFLDSRPMLGVSSLWIKDPKVPSSQFY